MYILPETNCCVALSKTILKCLLTDAVPLKLGYFGGSPSRSIHLDNVECDGTESSLLECQSNPIDVHNCDHSEDAGVRCEGTLVSKL